MQESSSYYFQPFFPFSVYHTTQTSHNPALQGTLGTTTSPVTCIDPNLLLNVQRNYPPWTFFDYSLPNFSSGTTSISNSSFIPIATTNGTPSIRPSSLMPLRVENTQLQHLLNYPPTARAPGKRKAGRELDDDEYIDQPRKKCRVNQGVSSKRRPKTRSLEEAEQVHQYVCGRDGCTKSFQRSRDLDRHKQSLKHSERNFFCECKQGFTREDPLKRHRRNSCKLWRAKNN